MKKILTVCHQGLCRSVGMADVLKMHFEPVDVVPVGIKSNTTILPILFAWADHIIIMQPHMAEKIPEEFHSKILVCDVGPDRYKNSKNRELIDQVWNWARQNVDKLGIVEHDRKL